VSVYRIEDLHGWDSQEYRDGRWVLARPLAGPFVLRLRAAWLVLSGKADAVVWE
jgi:hypothetical protein